MIPKGSPFPETIFDCSILSLSSASLKDPASSGNLKVWISNENREIAQGLKSFSNGTVHGSWRYHNHGSGLTFTSFSTAPAHPFPSMEKNFFFASFGLRVKIPGNFYKLIA